MGQLAYEILRLILLIGWALYPVGYVVGSMGGKKEEEMLNAIYNLADLVNKVAFGLAIFYAAQSQTELEKQVDMDAALPTAEQVVQGKSERNVLASVAQDLHEKLQTAHERVDNTQQQGQQYNNSTRSPMTLQAQGQQI